MAKKISLPRKYQAVVADEPEMVSSASVRFDAFYDRDSTFPLKRFLNDGPP